MKIFDQRWVVLDTETTGTDAETDKVVEIALVEVMKGQVNAVYSTLVNPERDIPAESSAIHHITNKKVIGQPTFAEVWPNVQRFVEGAVIVAHNAEFDKSMIPDLGLPWVCSYRLARHLWPSAPNHKNQTLRYWLDIEIDAGMAHSALADTLVTGHVFIKELEAYLRSGLPDSVDELIKYTASPITIQKMPFGKHYGELITDLPMDYVKWLLNNVTDMDKDLKLTLVHRLIGKLGQEATQHEVDGRPLKAAGSD